MLPELAKIFSFNVVALGAFTDTNLVQQEKPSEPKSNWCVPPFYIYEKNDTCMVKRGIEEGCGTDAPGSFIAWLCEKTTVYAMEMPGSRYDIGNLESYENAQKTYMGIVK